MIFPFIKDNFALVFPLLFRDQRNTPTRTCFVLNQSVC